VSLLREELPDLRIRVVNVGGFDGVAAFERAPTWFWRTKISMHCSRREGPVVFAVSWLSAVDSPADVPAAEITTTIHVRGFVEEGDDDHTVRYGGAQSHGPISTGVGCYPPGAAVEEHCGPGYAAFHGSDAAAQVVRDRTRRGNRPEVANWKWTAR